MLSAWYVSASTSAPPKSLLSLFRWRTDRATPSPGNWQITISNGSGIRSTEVTANSARSAWAWGDGWAQGLRTAGDGNWQVKDVEAL